LCNAPKAYPEDNQKGAHLHDHVQLVVLKVHHHILQRNDVGMLAKPPHQSDLSEGMDTIGASLAHGGHLLDRHFLASFLVQGRNNDAVRSMAEDLNRLVLLVDAELGDNFDFVLTTPSFMGNLESVEPARIESHPDLRMGSCLQSNKSFNEKQLATLGSPSVGASVGLLNTEMIGLRNSRRYQNARVLGRNQGFAGHPTPEFKDAIHSLEPPGLACVSLIALCELYRCETVKPWEREK
jgi:hypothetical protein